jgi:hypothetical protein
VLVDHVLLGLHLTIQDRIRAKLKLKGVRLKLKDVRLKLKGVRLKGGRLKLKGMTRGEILRARMKGEVEG